MNILHISKKYDGVTGGDAVVVHKLHLHQTSRGNTVNVVTSNSEQIEDQEHVIKAGARLDSSALDHMSFRRVFSLLVLLFQSFRIVRKFQPDVIHSHSPDMGFSFAFAARLFGCRFVHTCHGVTFTDMQHSWLKRFSEYALLKLAAYDAIFTVDPTVIDQFRLKGFRNVIFVPNGVDASKQKPLHTHKPMRFIAVGRLEEQKGFSFFIEALAILNNQGVPFSATIVGDGSLDADLKHLASALGVQINFTGKLSPLKTQQQIASSDVLVMPSLHEGFPLVLLEAWAARKAVIVTRVGANSVVCKHLENAFLIPSASSSKLAFALKELHNSPNLAKQLASAGYKLASSTYSWSSVVDLYEKLYAVRS